MREKGKWLGKLIQFEILYRVCLYLFVNPLLSQLLRLYLSRARSGMTFNSDIVMRFLSLPGIFLALFYMLAGTGLIVFEFSVILHLIDKGQRGEPLSIREACRQALFSLKSIRNLQLPFCTLYFALFLPAAHLVYINALIPRLRVPEFVIGELRLTVSGRLLINAFWLGLYGLAIFLLFVPLLMIFRRMKLSQAIKQNLRLWKQLSAKEQGRLALGCGFWFLAEFLVVDFLPKALLINSDFNRYFLKNLILSPTFRHYLMQSLLIQLAFFLMSLGFLYFLVRLIRTHGVVMMEEEPESEEAERLNEAVSRVRGATAAGVRKIQSWEGLHRWISRHPWISGLTLIILLCFGISEIFPDFITLLLPVILIVSTLYFLGAIVTKLRPQTSGKLNWVYVRLHGWLSGRRVYQRHPWMVRVLLTLMVMYCADLYLRPLSREHQPWAIGHRGSAYAVENTIEAVRQAAIAHADYAEIDVQLSADGIPMVYHDPTLTRLTGVNKKVEDLTAEQLQSLTLSTEGQYVKGKIPTLKQLIQTMKTWEGETGLLIELKPVNGNQTELAEKVIEVVESEDFAARSIFMSLDYEAVQILQRQRPQWWIGYCVYGTAGEMDYRIWNWNIDFLAVEESQISVSFLEQAGRAWMPVYVWTVDDYNKMSNYLDMGVSGLITNYPDLAREEIDDYMRRYPQYYQYQGKGYPIYEWETE